MATAQHLIDNGGGSMILTSSTSGLKGMPFLNPYTAAKHGVVGIMRAFASELAEHNIRVNSVHPTGVLTNMHDGTQEVIGGLLQRHPQLGGMLVNMLPVQISQPIDVSNAVLYLASDESRLVTSTTFKVDAGASEY
jgi:NAD(P)-dependent dehydrogenase (short-subunit alcohol dehydrogenase family)